jgi:hypothetical protein
MSENIGKVKLIDAGTCREKPTYVSETDSVTLIVRPSVIRFSCWNLAMALFAVQGEDSVGKLEAKILKGQK